MTGDTRIAPTEIAGVYGAVVKFGVRRMIGEVPDAYACGLPPLAARSAASEAGVR